MLKRICDIEGYEKVRDWYMISSDGRVLSNASNPIYEIEENKELKLLKKTGGYLYACLVCNDGTKKYSRVHRLVALAFIPNPHNYDQVNHVDKNKTNNNVSNLEWLSASDNSRYSNSKEMFCYSREGELVKHYANAIEVLNDGFTSHAFSVAKGIMKSHRNHYFSYTRLTKSEVLQRLSKSYPKKSRRK